MRTDIPLIPVAFERRMESPLWDILVPLTKDGRARRDGLKRCTGCGAMKPLHQFHVHRRNSSPADRYSRCKTCRSEAYRNRKRAA